VYTAFVAPSEQDDPIAIGFEMHPAEVTHAVTGNIQSIKYLGQGSANAKKSIAFAFLLFCYIFTVV